ncbi:MAG TPA: hypothetical protein DCG48_07175 [Rhodospirillaceae bacterium]|nr:hypothetical protein [Rhodospirillaceae bacterium]|tara:strand:+ start:135 stop:371 length:237 start_codon:yes stop_codon:yes gene_type:complete
MNSKNKTFSTGLSRALVEIQDLADSGIKFVPERPSPAMTQAGALAGGIDEDKAAKIYRAMLEAESLEDSHHALKTRPN